MRWTPPAMTVIPAYAGIQKARAPPPAPSDPADIPFDRFFIRF